MYATDQPPAAPELPRQPAARRTTQPEPAKCPRCASTNTKFCYYNNYNKSQPRHYCKSCKRHWTKGGTLRNVPVGGSKNKRPRITSAAASGVNNNHIDQKSRPGILYQALIGGAPSQREKTDNAFELGSPSNPRTISYHFNIDSPVTKNNINDDNSISVDINNIPGSSSVTWPSPDTGISCFDFDLLPNYWNWSHEIDHLNNISWDEMKP